MTSDNEKADPTSAPVDSARGRSEDRRAATEDAEGPGAPSPANDGAQAAATPVDSARARPEGRDAAEAPAAEKPEKAEPTVEQKLADALAEAARLREQLLRTAADFDNFRKRARRQEDEERRRGRELLLKDLLPVFDNLERAVAHAEGAPDVKSVADGLRMVLKQFVDTLERGGIKRVPTVGHAFDPTKHEAIQHLASTQHPAGVVLHEVQPGYMIGDYLVRAAMVVVSKGPPEGEAAAS